MKKLILFLLTAVLTMPLLAQQSWQWGKRGGGGTNEVISGGLYESVVDIAVDPAGNVYTLSNLLFDQNDVNVDGNALTGRYTDMVISSFSCTGQFRWAKVLGSPTTDFAIALKADTLGGIYISGVLNGFNSGDYINISSDTILQNSYRTLFLVKYDTAGNYKWLQRPQPDTATTWTLSKGNFTLDMDVDKAGNSYSMCYLSKGAYGGAASTYVTSASGVHMLRYDRNGNFLGGNPMAITVPEYNSPVSKWWLTRTQSGNFIVNGMPSYSGTPLTFGSTAIDKPGFVASFNSNGTLGWVKQSTLGYVGAGANTVFRKASVDAGGNIYLSGNGAPADAFAGITFANPIGYAPGLSTPAVFKLDSAGNTLWGKFAYSSYSSDGLAGALNTNGEYVLGGVWAGNMYWPGSAADSVTHPANWLQAVFLTRFNAQTGAFLKTDTLYSPPGDNQQVTAMTADRKGNVYVGGSFQSGLQVAATNLIANPGGYFDFFVAKYGSANCNCIAPPVAAITQTSINNAAQTATFRYSGTTTALDSLVWEWGSGQRQRFTGNFTASVTHTFSTGTHNPCVTAYSKDCQNTACKTISFTPVGIPQPESAGEAALVVAPNPAAVSTRIDYRLAPKVQSASLELYDLVGRKVGSRQLTEVTGSRAFDLSNLPAGTYLIILRQQGGNTLQTKLVVAP